MCECAGPSPHPILGAGGSWQTLTEPSERFSIFPWPHQAKCEALLDPARSFSVVQMGTTRSSSCPNKASFDQLSPAALESQITCIYQPQGSSASAADTGYGQDGNLLMAKVNPLVTL